MPINKGFFTPLFVRFLSARPPKNSAFLFLCGPIGAPVSASSTAGGLFADFSADFLRTFFAKNSARFYVRSSIETCLKSSVHFIPRIV